MTDSTKEEQEAYSIITNSIKNCPIDINFTNYCIEMFIIDHPNYLDYKTKFTGNTWRFLKQLSIFDFAEIETLIMFEYLQRYYKKPRQERLLLLAPKDLLICAAFVCLSFSTDEFFTKKSWESLTSMEWDKINFYAIRFCKEIDFNMRVNASQIYNVYKILSEANNVYKIISDYNDQTRS